MAVAELLEAGGEASKNARRARVWATEANARTQHRYDLVRRSQLSAIKRQWESRRRCWDRSGVVVCMAQEDFGAHLALEGVLDQRPGKATVVRATGEIDLCTAPNLWACLESLLGEGHSMVLDLGEVTFMDARGVSVLLMASQLAKESGAAFVVKGATGIVDRVLSITGARGLLRGDQVEAPPLSTFIAGG